MSGFSKVEMSALGPQWGHGGDGSVDDGGTGPAAGHDSARGATADAASAAALLGLSARQVRRLYRAFRRDGAKALASCRRGRPSNRRIAAATRDHALRLVR